MKKARMQKWFDNTLFIFIADHGYFTPRGWSYDSPQYHKIPLLFYGHVLKDEFRGKKNERLCSQNDFPATLLSQFSAHANGYNWSMNLMNPYSGEFGFWIFYDGFGWITPNGWFAWDNRFSVFNHKEFPDSSKAEKNIRQGKAYMQAVFRQYLEY
jgi:hypothetical protein